MARKNFPTEKNLSNKQRRDRDIHKFVTDLMTVKIDGQEVYKYQAILRMAEKEFYLAPDTIADIVRDYVPPEPDPDQLGLDLFEDEQPATK